MARMRSGAPFAWISASSHMVVVECGHVARIGVEGDGVRPRPLGENGSGPVTHDLAGEGVQGSLHRVTFDLPAVRMVMQSCIVAKCCGMCELDQQLVLGGVHVSVAQAKAALRGIAVFRRPNRSDPPSRSTPPSSRYG